MQGAGSDESMKCGPAFATKQGGRQTSSQAGAFQASTKAAHSHNVTNVSMQSCKSGTSAGRKLTCCQQAEVSAGSRPCPHALHRWLPNPQADPPAPLVRRRRAIAQCKHCNQRTPCQRSRQQGAVILIGLAAWRACLHGPCYVHWQGLGCGWDRKGQRDLRPPGDCYAGPASQRPHLAMVAASSSTNTATGSAPSRRASAAICRAVAVLMLRLA